ncbi:hypothetical protein PFICI_04113 [Pestalotiopsis fici W106-1]|uniref:Heterokaryon incompatibility domain-containing protein n=1 Tax=Pestalotiopsis fici (strain W106-1 / CGMCC3.15140) TaxID=1229662 RepID=W3XJ45_PESFW|nr:uncharacterized protein PFICI_04113 [Pestalotiopsis fici W106-1]ETS86088.1 hypothetical protein PFICI_04113 [Pestalotiopsis fici W106-1]
MDPSSLFRTAALFQATDPRDKVYALVAFESLNFHRFWRIRVDYKLTTAQVYCQATAGCILQSKGLNILYHIHHGDTNLDEPFSTPGRSLIEGEFATWVPQLKGVHYSNAFAWEERWTAHGELVTAFEEDDAEYQKFHVRGVEPSRHGNHEHVPLHYHTSQVVSAIQCPRDSSIKTLKVRGIQVDVAISGSMPLNPAWWDPKHKNFTPVLLSLLNDMQVSRQPDLESQTTMERAQGILSSILQATIEDDDTSRNQLRLYWSYVVNVVKTMRGKTLPPDFYNTFPGLTSLTEEQMRQGEEWVARVQQYTCYRRVFRTCRGIWGNGPSSMRANDIVVVVYGIIVPLVLRPSGDKWQLVGTCYLHGYMHGLAVEEFKMGKLEMQVFEIE